MSPTAPPDRDYVLGTHDEEVARLGLQHRLWRDRALDGWRRAGVGPGSRVMDLGAGPGFATLDLADVVGPEGSVVAVERSRRFLSLLEAEVARRGLTQVTTREADLDELDSLPASDLDAIWCRWIVAFVRHPHDLVHKMLAALRPGGVVVLHEYLDYSTWRLMPDVPSFEVLVRAVVTSWREQGGEPNIGAALPKWFEDAGAQVVSLRPYVDVITPADSLWQWPAAFVASATDRLVAIDRLEAERAHAIRRDFTGHCAQPGARMVTPLVMELIVRKA